MNEQVNLLQNSGGKNYATIITKLRVIRFVAIAALFVTAAFSIMLFLIITFSPLPRLQQEEERLIANLNSGENREKMDKYYFIRSRLSDIDNLIVKRPEIISSYELIESAFTPSMKVNFLDISETAITVSISSPNLADVEAAVNTLSQKVKGNKQIASMTLSNITYDAKDNIYEMVVTITQS